MKFAILAVAVALVSAPAAHAVTVDGTLDAAYGAAKSTVTYLPGAPESNFQAPTPYTDAIGYSIYLTSDANYVYGFLQASGPGQAVASFANIYWDLDPANGNGSDIGFELSPTHADAFVAGVSGSVDTPDVKTAASADGLGIEFAIPTADFTGPIAGLDYQGFNGFAADGSNIVLRLSQSFGYSVAGGPTYGDDRLGAVQVGMPTSAAPEPATWALMMAGVGLAGAALRRRRAAGLAAA